MTRTSRRLAVVFACIALTLSVRAIEPPKSTEQWVALEAENFRFVSAVSPRQTLEIARDLLCLRAALGKVSDFKLETAEPTRVFVFRRNSASPRIARRCAARGATRPPDSSSKPAAVISSSCLAMRKAAWIASSTTN